MPSDSSEKIKYEEEINALVAWVDCKTVGFFSKSVKKSVKRGVRRLTRASLTRPGKGGGGVWGERNSVFSLVPDLLFDLKNTDCFAVYCIWFNSVVIHSQMWPEQRREVHRLLQKLVITSWKRVLRFITIFRRLAIPYVNLKKAGMASRNIVIKKQYT